MENLKGIPVNVLRTNGQDCTAGGASSTQDDFILVGDEVKNCPFEVEEDVPYLVVVKRFLFGRDYYHAEVYLNGAPLKNGEVGPMFGGNYCKTSDSRFPNDYPIGIHDRWESQECYNSMSI